MSQKSRESNTSKSNLESIKNSFSIKNFISDLPRMLNNVFGIIYNCITSFYEPDTDTLKSSNIKAGYIEATTIVTQNLTFKGSNGEMYNYNDIADILNDLETRVNNIVPITREQLDLIDRNSTNTGNVNE